MKYAAIGLPEKQIFTPFFDTKDDLEEWIDYSNCEPLDMIRVLGEDYDIIQISNNLLYEN